MQFDREQMKASAAALATKGVFLGKTSWEYAGWPGSFTRATVTGGARLQHLD